MSIADPGCCKRTDMSVLLQHPGSKVIMFAASAKFEIIIALNTAVTKRVPIHQWMWIEDRGRYNNAGISGGNISNEKYSRNNYR